MVCSILGCVNVVAVGYAHKPNFLKFRILDALYHASEPLTTRDIERITGVQYTTISAAMSRYQYKRKRNGTVIKLPYIERLEKKGRNGLYRYRITKRGEEAREEFLSRIRAGVSLNRIKQPDHIGKKVRSVSELEMMPYYSFTAGGIEDGMNLVNIVRVEGKIKAISSCEQ